MDNLISIIVPIYNVEKYLSTCIESILAQKFKNTEIILVDDGSTDDSYRICIKYAKKDNRIKVINKENGGLSSARNAGLDLAKGKYIGFVDSDDYISIDMYSNLYKALVETNSNIAIGGRYRVYENEISTEKYRRYPANNVLNPEEALSALMSYKGFDMSVCDKLFEKSLFDNIRFPDGKTCEDSYVTYKLIGNAKKVVYDKTPYYYYYQRQNSISRNSLVNETVIDACEEQLEFILKFYPKLDNEAYTAYIVSTISVYNEYIKRGQVWLDVQEHRKYARRHISRVVRNKNINWAKKIQIIIYSFSIKSYKIAYSIIG